MFYLVGRGEYAFFWAFHDVLFGTNARYLQTAAVENNTQGVPARVSSSQWAQRLASRCPGT
jgi:hypothetical protein